MNINLVYDSSVDTAPTGFRDAMAYAAQQLDGDFSSPITVNIQVGFGEIQGDPVSSEDDGLGGPENGTTLTYGQLKNDLAQNAVTPDAKEAVSHLPGSDPTGGSTFYVGGAERKALGLLAPDAAGIDGAVGFSAAEYFNYNPNSRAVPGEVDFIGVAEHELTHAMGRVAGLEPGSYEALDLFRYGSPGSLQLQYGQAAYFSIDGGQTDLDNFDSSADPGDWAVGNQPDANNVMGQYGVASPFTQTDVTEMDALGFDSPAVHYNRTLNGAGGSKTFTFTTQASHVLINHFELAGPGHDTIHLPAEFSTLRDVLTNTTMSHGAAVIHLGTAQNDITLAGVTKAQLKAHPQDFGFSA